jgi:hypothetical protein
MEAQFAALLSRLEAVTTKLEAGGAGAGGAKPAAAAPPADDGVVSPAVQAFDDLIAGEVSAFVTAASAIGDDLVKAQAETAKKAFEAQREMLLVVSKAAKPSPADFQSKCAAAAAASARRRLTRVCPSLSHGRPARAVRWQVPAQDLRAARRGAGQGGPQV